jgi:putative ABC transport system permease protein
MIKSVSQLLAVDPGVDSKNVLLMSIALPQKDFYGPPVRTTFCADVEREVSSLPGVRSVAAMSHLPFEGNAGRGFEIEGRPVPAEGDGAGANYRLTCPGYFGTLAIPVTSGRDFTLADTTTAPGVVIINEETAKRYWPGANPVGQRIKIGSSAPWLTIVGIVANVRHFGLDNAARREIYRPYSQAAWPVMTVTVKTAVEPMTLAAPVRSALARIDPEQPVSRIRTMDRVVSESVGGRRFPTQLLGLFSFVAFVLAAIGVYGVVSYLVSQRTREIGIRVALGARRSQVIRLVVLRSLIPIVSGLVAGVGGAVAASRLLGTLLYEVRPTDPMVLGSIVSLLGTAAVVASFIPARRASGIDPIVVLRQD